MPSSGLNGIMNYENEAINLQHIDRELSSLGNHEQEIQSGIAACCETATFARDCDGYVNYCEKEQRANKQGEKHNEHCSQDGNLVMLLEILKTIVREKIHLMNTEQRLVKRVYSPLSLITL